ncbi:2-keto-3-deoxygluconate permease [Pseudodesulfovibrio thermohalotolerans]|uniref:2-keto-3-deoxygluconate permease n=1 Tax=Pseudodesulfovibrio thermohalotolerans TaxID=2880651 RepID=UPI0024428972|nr:2-keto-3-deoxygluconate permease [Pseudodesulfovibrio thermohalotolerans]WFS62322.1 2-keto-3-deoxygluconate permease [Pseudodesulfovibrio thermohalotolerans]
MKILKTVKRIPGGLVAVPLVLGAIMHTFFPGVLGIGSFTTAVFSSKGAACLVGLSFLFIGSQLKVREAPEVIRRGGVILLVKFSAGAGFGLLVGKMFGMDGILGLSVLALISSITNGNGGLYMALMCEFGDSKDVAANSLLQLNDGPFLTLLALGTSGMANIPLVALIAAIGPLIIGVILGNLDEDLADFFKPGVEMIIPLFSFALGAGINLSNVATAGLSGILLGFLVIAISGIPLVLADRYINKRPGYAGMAAASAAGNSVATPAAIGLVDPHWQPYVNSATAQVAAAVVITAIFIPLLTSWVAKRYGSAKDLNENPASCPAEVERV